MRHTKLGRKKDNRTQLVKNLAASLIVYERITTTSAKAKLVQGYVERIISQAKKMDKLNSYKMALQKLGKKKPAQKVIDIIISNFKDTQSGFTRIINIGPRKGDAAPMVIIELTKKTAIPKTNKVDKKEKAKPAKKKE